MNIIFCICNRKQVFNYRFLKQHNLIERSIYLMLHYLNYLSIFYMISLMKHFKFVYISKRKSSNSFNKIFK